MKIHRDISLASYTSLHIGGRAHRLIELEPSDSLAHVLTELPKDEQVQILGYGTNVLISDRGLPGTVIRNRTGKIMQLDAVTFKAESGASWDTLVQTAIHNNVWGLEFSSGIPGGIGAAVAGNIAAYGHKVADSLISATVFDEQTNKLTDWKNDDFAFTYRGSALQQPKHKSKIIIDATFRLSTGPTGPLEYESALKVARELGIEPNSLPNRRKIILETRRRAGSLLKNVAQGPWTAGSFFKNPIVTTKQAEVIVGHEETSATKEQLLRQNKIHSGDKMRVSAAHVLLAAGFKRGQTWGNVRLHPEHILKIENTGGATAQDIHEVVQIILKTVKDKLDVTLEPEVRFLGKF